MVGYPTKLAARNCFYLLVGCCVLYWPNYYIVLSSHNSEYFKMLILLSTIPLSMYYSSAPTFFIELLPAKHRCGLFSIYYSLASSFFLGITPYVTQKLLSTSEGLITLCNSLAIMTLLSLITLLFCKEPTEEYKLISKFSIENLKI